MNLYNNKIAVVTGAASGIGRAISRKLVENGCKVHMLDINEEQLKKSASDLGNSAIPYQLDVTNYDSFKEIVSAIISSDSRIDFVFNNAGIAFAGEMTGYSIEAWNKILDVNVRGIVNSVQLIYPIMKEQRSGHIINTSSLAGLVPSGLLVPYATSKHAITGLSRSLKVEAQLFNVKVHVLCPGAVETALLDNSHPDDMPESARIGAREYLTKITGKPVSADDFAVVVLDKIAKNKELIFYPRKVKEIWNFSRFFPKKLSKLARKAVQEEMNLSKK
jgi:NADP-dependent 3-hydroxy acid dehydrogenase YdfG